MAILFAPAALGLLVMASIYITDNLTLWDWLPRRRPVSVPIRLEPEPEPDPEPPSIAVQPAEFQLEEAA